MRELVDVSITNLNNLDRDVLYFDSNIMPTVENWHYQLLQTTMEKHYEEIAERLDIIEELPRALNLAKGIIAHFSNVPVPDGEDPVIFVGRNAIATAKEKDIIEALNILEIKVVYLSNGIMFIKTTTDYGKDIYKQLVGGLTPYTLTVYNYQKLTHSRTHVVWTTEVGLAEDIGTLVAEPVLVDRPTVAHINEYLKVRESRPGVYESPAVRMLFSTFLKLVPEKGSETLVTLEEIEYFKRDEGEWSFADINDSVDISELFRSYSGTEVLEMILKNPDRINVETAVVIGMDDNMNIVTLNKEEYDRELLSNIDELELLRWVYNNDPAAANSYIEKQKRLLEAQMGLDKGGIVLTIVLTTGPWD